jgi:hypothetical protein
MKASMALRLSTVTELLAGTVLIFVPGAVVRALIGVSSTAVDEVLGAALLALGVTGMLARGSRAGRPAAFGFATYDAVAARVLASAAVAGGESFEVPDDVHRQMLHDGNRPRAVRPVPRGPT